MATPNQDAIDGGAVTVEFGEKKWPVPKLAFKQLILVHKILDRLAGVIITNETPMGELTDKDLEDLAFLLFVALGRANTITREEFDDMPTTRKELIMAFYVVLVQASGTVAPSATEAEAVPGEAPGPESP